MPVLIERVCRTIERSRLLPPGARVIVAASGGADSTALAWLLHELAARLDIEVAALAHFNHRLRDTASELDEAFCRDLAARLGVPFRSAAGDVRGAARALGTSVEDAGRRLRYAFLDETRQRFSASHVAVGHTRDDLAETVLLNLLRGAGTRGLGGMPPVRAEVVRPLLECSHSELVGWLGSRGESFREDESNLDRRFLRNRIRHEVLPVLRAAFPDASAALARSATVARRDADYLDELAEEALGRVSEDRAGRVVILAGRLAGMPQALATRVARLVLMRLSTGRFVGYDHAARLLELAAGARRGSISLPGVQADLVGGQLILERRQGRGAPGPGGPGAVGGTSRPVALSIPGEALLGDGRAVSSELRQDRPSLDDLRKLAGGDTAVVDAAACAGLAVRFRRAGDRFRPLGLDGHKTLQDLFVDRKVPRGERGAVPLVVDAADRIVWVAGHAVSGDFGVSEATRAVVILKLRGERV